MSIYFTSLSQRVFFLVLIASNNCRFQPPQSGCVTGWAWTPSASSQDSPSQSCKPQTSLATSWVYDNRTIMLIQSKLILLLDSSPPSQGPGSSQEQQAHLTHPPACIYSLLGPVLCPQLPMLRTGASRCCTLSCASNDCHGVTLLAYTHPSHSSACMILCFDLFFLLRISCFYSAPLFHLFLVMAWDSCISKSEEWLRPEVEGSKHQSPILGCAYSILWTSSGGRFSFCRVKDLQKFLKPYPLPALPFNTAEKQKPHPEEAVVYFLPSHTKYSLSSTAFPMKHRPF